MRITRTTNDGRRVSFRPEDVLMDLQGNVADGELTREAAIGAARFALGSLSQDDIDEWFPEE